MSAKEPKPDAGLQIGVFDLLDTLVHDNKPIAGMKELLSVLKNAGWELHLCTSYGKGDAQSLMKPFGDLIPSNLWHTEVSGKNRAEELRKLLETKSANLFYVDDRLETLTAAQALKDEFRGRFKMIGFGGAGRRADTLAHDCRKIGALSACNAADLAGFLGVELPPEQIQPAPEPAAAGKGAAAAGAGKTHAGQLAQLATIKADSWDKLAFTVNPESMTVNGIYVTAADLGLTKKNTDTPNAQWILLCQFAQAMGHLTAETQKGFKINLPVTVTRLRSALHDAFPGVSKGQNPIVKAKTGYKTIFAIVPGHLLQGSWGKGNVGKEEAEVT